MTFKEYAESVAKLLADRPDLADAQVIFSCGHEVSMNGFDSVDNGPTVGYFDKTGFHEENPYETQVDPNAVLVA